MSNGNLSLKVDPFRLAEQCVEMEGVLQVKNMGRLCSGLYSPEGEVKVKLRFDKDRQGIRFLRSQTEARVMLQCQRCMEPYSHEIKNDSMLGIIAAEEESNDLPGRYDPVVAKDGILMIQDMVEEELILSLPIVAMHQPKDCKVKSESESEMAVEKENPFKVIEFLKEETSNGSPKKS